jgi:hypothetical protein
MRAHIEKGLADALVAEAAKTDKPLPMSGKTAFAEPLVAHVTRVHEQLEKARREERESEAAWMRGVTRNNESPQTFFTDPVTGGRKETKLARHDLLPPDIVHELAEHYGKGARKYGERNMEKGYPWSKTYAACHRHLNAFWQGEDVDAETGSLHLVAAAWHCFTMAWFLRHNAGTDDRPVTGKKGDTRE